MKDNQKMTCFRTDSESKKHLLSHLVLIEADVQDFFNAFVEHFLDAAFHSFDGCDYDFSKYPELEGIIESAISKTNARHDGSDKRLQAST